MTRTRRIDVVITGVSLLTPEPGAPLTPARWAGAAARLARMDRLCALALVACDGALLDGALAPGAPEWDGARAAIVFGSAYGCHATNEEYYRGVVREGQLGASPRLFAYTLPSSPVGEISIHYGVRGPAITLCNGLTSGLDVLAEGVRLIEEGRADRVLVCAAEVATPLLTRILAAAPPSLYAEAPRDAAAALLLERAGDAAARGATPRGRLLAADGVFRDGERSAAVASAVARVLAEADVAAGAARQLLAGPADAAIARSAGVTAPAADFVTGALGAAPLLAAARFVSSAPAETLALACAGDDGGAATAALLLTG